MRIPHRIEASPLGRLRCVQTSAILDCIISKLQKLVGLYRPQLVNIHRSVVAYRQTVDSGADWMQAHCATVTVACPVRQ